jgi:hypothetical protein
MRGEVVFPPFAFSPKGLCKPDAAGNVTTSRPAYIANIQKALHSLKVSTLDLLVI